MSLSEKDRLIEILRHENRKKEIVMRRYVHSLRRLLEESGQNVEEALADITFGITEELDLRDAGQKAN